MLGCCASGVGPDLVRHEVRGYVAERLVDPGGVLIGDETGFVKQGRRSAGSSGSIQARRVGWRIAIWRYSDAYANRPRSSMERPGICTAEVVDRRPARCCADAGVPVGYEFRDHNPCLAARILALAPGLRRAVVVGDRR